MAQAEFHFDFGSPNAYLSHLVLPEIERRTSARFEYVPILLGGIFKLTNNRSPAESMVGIRNKPEYERLVKERLLANTQRSIERGSFGSPTFFVGDEIFFGKDRLRDVEEALQIQPRSSG